MPGTTVRLLRLSGSLRQDSTNTALLRASTRAAPAGVAVRLFDGLGDLPVFNPDLERDPWPPAVTALRAAVRDADGLLIACPEYAHGIPGGLKNALDWLVSGDEAPGKPVALLRASDRSRHAHEALVEVLRTMSMAVRTEAALVVPLMGLDPDGCRRALDRPETLARIGETLAGFAASIRGEGRRG